MRYLRARRRDAFISITTIFTAIGVMIGVAALVMVLAVMGGFEQSLRQRILTLTPQVQILSFNGSISGYDALLARANAVPGVAGSDPFIVGQAMISSPRGISGVIVRGIDPKRRDRVPAPALYSAGIARQPGCSGSPPASATAQCGRGGARYATGDAATRRTGRSRSARRSRKSSRSRSAIRSPRWSRSRRTRQRYHHQDRSFHRRRDLRVGRRVPRPRPGLHGSG